MSARLFEFGLDFQEDIFASITDGAQVMKKFGRISPANHQLCYLHALHLAVSDVYENRSLNVVPLAKMEGHSSDLFNELPNFAGTAYSDSDSGEDTESNDGSEEGEQNVVPTCFARDANDSFPYRETFNSLQPALRKNYREIIDNVRTVVKLFRKSPMKNDKLQLYVKEQFGKELALKLNVKTRWHSMCEMLERFLNIRLAVAKALIDFNIPLSLTPQEYILLTYFAH